MQPYGRRTDWALKSSQKSNSSRQSVPGYRLVYLALYYVLYLFKIFEALIQDSRCKPVFVELHMCSSDKIKEQCLVALRLFAVRTRGPDPT